MAKKRRHALRAPATSREAAVDVEKSLYNLETYYDQLSADVVEVPVSLDDALLLHSLMALVVQNILLVVQGVSIVQIALLGGSAVWMMRKSLMTKFLPPVALLISRIAVLVLLLTGFRAGYYYFELALKTTELVHFAIICLLDVASMYFDRGAKGRLFHETIVLSAVEHAMLVAGFSNCPVHTQGIVIDTAAFALTTMTAFVHVVVILTTKYVVLHCLDADMDGTFVRTQQRGAKLLESLWQDIDCFEPKKLLAGFAEASKKKKVKSKVFASPLETNSACNNTSLDRPLHTQQSPFNEPRVQLAILILVQMLLLLSQLLLSAFVLNSWEMISALVISSSRLLWTLAQVRRKVLSRRTIRPTDSKVKTA